ncbi:MAG: cytochrome c [Bacteroidetes bacterium]|nr:cytochrome c [Bacteroidota bacterium]
MTSIKKGLIGVALLLLSINFLGFKSDIKLPDPIMASVLRGKEVYKAQCLACHQQDGGGVPHMNPPLDGALNVNGNDKARLIRIVLNGLADRVEIEGEMYSNSMASHKDLSNQQIADVLTYIRNSWTNKAGLVTVEEVKIGRSKLR